MSASCKALRALGPILVLAWAIVGAARAQDLSQPVILVASAQLDDTPFEQSVVIAVPLANGTHFGFIINKPTKVKLDALFPDDAAARNVQDPVYLGGPKLFPGVFALTANAPTNAALVVPLVSGVVAVLDGSTIDRIIQNTPNDARYFVGAVVWDAGELEEQVSSEAWQVRPADAGVLLRARTPGLWNALRRPMA